MDNHELFPIPEKTEKQRHWDEVAHLVERIVDGLQKPIDEGIREGIVALNVLGVHTSGSCEGHLDHGTCSPWIDIQAKIPRELEEEYRKLFRDRDENRDKFIEVRDDIRRRNLLEQKKVIPYLEIFYIGREVSVHSRLILESPILGRLESQGARFQDIEDDSVKRERLKEYQEEMNAFIAFLKEKYFGSES